MNRVLNLAVASVFSIGISSFCFAEDVKSDAMKDGREVLTKANEAVKGIKVVQYTAKLEGSGPDAAKIPNIEATAIVQGWKNNSFEKFKFEGTIKDEKTPMPEKYSVGTDGDIYYLTDWQKKMVYADMDPAVQGKRGDGFRNIIVSRFVRPEGYQMELSAPTIELKDPIKIGDADCYHIVVKYKGGDQSEWYFAKKDFLPRRVDRNQPSEKSDEKTVRILTLSEVTPNPTFVQDPFKVAVPEGFKKTDDFAP
ncbi:MAG: hypothetical protein HY287_03205 [Planctomycetes bacterium]|nr:hypothetical protein [Planctomycetota bacterium]MBI3833319.1 hypothetical protein [Planctomycetota bacterium]